MHCANYYNLSPRVKTKEKPYIKVNTRELSRVLSTDVSTLYISRA